MQRHRRHLTAPGTTGPCQFKYDGAGNVVTDKSGNEPRYVTYDVGQRIQEITRGEAKVSHDSWSGRSRELGFDVYFFGDDDEPSDPRGG